MKDFILGVIIGALIALAITGFVNNAHAAQRRVLPERPAELLVARDYFYDGYQRAELSEIADMNWNGEDNKQTLIVERHYFKLNAKPTIVSCWKTIRWFETEKAICLAVDPKKYEKPKKADVTIPYFTRNMF